MAHEQDPALPRFAADVRATLKGVEDRMGEALADAMDAAATSIKLRAVVPMSDAAARERDRCARIARRHWWMPGWFIATKLGE